MACPMEKTTPATVIIGPAILDSMPREPAAPAPNRRGQLSLTSCTSIRSVSISASASVTAAQTITAGTNQKLDRRSVQRSRGVFMIVRVACLSVPFDYVLIPASRRYSTRQPRSGA